MTAHLTLVGASSPAVPDDGSFENVTYTKSIAFGYVQLYGYASAETRADDQPVVILELPRERATREVLSIVAALARGDAMPYCAAPPPEPPKRPTRRGRRA